MNVQLLVRPYAHRIGLARYAASLCEALERVGVPYCLVTPRHSWPVRLAHSLLRPVGLDVRTFFTTYPLAADLKPGILTHLTAQQMAMLLWFRPDLHPVVVTVHDIVPYLTRRDPGMRAYQNCWEEWLDVLATRALNRADGLIVDSAYTRETVARVLGYPPERIWAVPLGVDPALFAPRPVPPEFDARYGLDRRCRYVLYVGSENPRKNLPFLLRAFARLHQDMPNVRLIRVGAVQYLPQARALEREVRELGLTDAVLHFSAVPDEDLVLFYNRADLFVFPSLYEGFGLPVLEAMACGTPVVCSDAASLPEVAGDAALQVSPSDEEGWAEAMYRALTDAHLREELRARGLERARAFTWERTAEETVQVYQEIFAQRYCNLKNYSGNRPFSAFAPFPAFSPRSLACFASARAPSATPRAAPRASPRRGPRRVAARGALLAVTTSARGAPWLTTSTFAPFQHFQTCP
ncbi:MAG: glycosyltransferase family 4 protein, partial [Anaerolineae bacterium]|nr:glycosyltransferase family 4 protein [Anaerolineae bacterium]